MNWLDILILIFLVISVVGGIISGLIRALFGLIGLIVGVVLAGHYYMALADHLGFISNSDAARVVAFLIIFIAVSAVALLLGFIFTKIISAISLGWLNRVLGGVFGLFTGAIMIAALLILLVKYSGIGDTVSNSVLATFLIDKLPVVIGLLPNEFDTVKEYFN